MTFQGNLELKQYLDDGERKETGCHMHTANLLHQAELPRANRAHLNANNLGMPNFVMS